MPETMTAKNLIPTEAERLDFARKVWLQLLETARRLRPLADHVFQERTPEGFKAVRYTAGESWDNLKELVGEGDRRSEGSASILGACRKLEEALSDSKYDLLSIAALAHMAETVDAGTFPEATTTDYGNAIDRLVWTLEERIGGSWCESDSALPERWAATHLDQQAS